MITPTEIAEAPVTDRPRRERILALPVTYYPNKHNPVRARRTVENCPANLRLFETLHTRRHPLLDLVFAYTVWFGKAIVLLPIVLALFAWCRPALLPLLLAVVTETIIVAVIKSQVIAPRPAMMLPHVTPLEKVYVGSFPSGDAALAGAICASLYPFMPAGGRLLLIGYVLAIMYGRIYVGAHFPLDILFGATIGLTAGAIAHTICLAIVCSQHWVHLAPIVQAIFPC